MSSDDNKFTSQATSLSTTADSEEVVLTTPGYEFPKAVYITVIGAFAWMFAIAWVAFGSADGTDLDLGIASVLAIVSLAIPLAIHHTAFRRTHEGQTPLHKFMAVPFDTFTGDMPARQAWLEVALIPVALAVAATLFGAAFLLSG